MSKLSAEEKFIDLSDYGRPIAIKIAQTFSNTSITPVHVTLMFGISGLTASWLIIKGYYAPAGLFLILKSILDAADGELARMKRTPSYTGRYLDSVFDIILNFIILFTIQQVTGQPLWLMLFAFASIQLQGTLYNYYYVILRQKSAHGDKTSRIFETDTPKALPGEKQWSVNLLFNTYLLFYTLFDRIIYFLDRNASESDTFPKWFMTLLSLYGLGFQLMIIAIFLSVGLIGWILPFFIWYSVGILIFIGIRKALLN
ncbi:CDP-alcohol phosphatidyltransferase family protein [Rhodohalobacter barkolensis]|uniref:CDP-alcohol phosphatidyltransferase n=1 Tax=Rhodohalobacter barkolensis TaxID=2053187 RepID=A0A2N0VIP6_9BACT|nr:CDP-alcohol phosphatidyltransferase family protein [Rhodohalobacter barkolensis]PKD43998.1 CDP-alcohol phosphatidyltransferase [Rhodohalobacter barkolensis]